MRLTLYHSHLCPRCHMARKALTELLQTMEGMEMEEVEVITNPLRTLRDGVKLIPTLRCGEHQLSGVLLSRKQLQHFLQELQSQ